MADLNFDRFAESCEKCAQSVATFAEKLTTVATAALAFTVTFRGQLITKGATTPWLLHLAWIGLGVTILSGALAYFGFVRWRFKQRGAELKALNDQMAIAIKSGNEAFFETRSAKRLMEIDKLLLASAVVSLLAFIVAIACLIAFGIVSAV